MKNRGFLGYSSDFWLLCAAGMFFFASFNMVIPEMPDFLTQLGAPGSKKYIIASFSFVALLSRPFSGKITDKVGRLPVMLFGVIVSFACGIGYVFTFSVAMFFVLRGLHGLAVGFTPTGNVAYIADIVPAERRGEAMGWVGISGNIGTALGPAIGGWVAADFGMNATFILSSVFAAFALLIMLKMKETLPVKEKLNVSHFQIKWSDFWEVSVRRVSVVMALSVFSFGTILTVVPDMTSHFGFANKGLFFTVFVLASIIPRLFAGKASDHYGREPVTKLGLFLLLGSLVVLAFTNSGQVLMLGAALMGVAQGVISPTLFAWTSDLAPPDGKGRSMATLYIALELGVTLGAFVSGSVYNNHIPNLFWTFLVCAALALCALVYLFVFKPKSYI
jgi:MFS family permease